MVDHALRRVGQCAGGHGSQRCDGGAFAVLRPPCRQRTPSVNLASAAAACVAEVVADLAHAMALAGAASVAEVTPDLVVLPRAGGAPSWS